MRHLFSLVLGGDQQIADFGVPGFPVRPADVIEDLRSEEQIIKVVAPLRRIRRPRAQVADARSQPQVVRLPSQVFPAQQADSGRSGGTVVCAEVAISAAVGGLACVEPAAHAGPDGRRQLNPGVLRRLEGQDLPTRHGGIGSLFRYVAPTTGKALAPNDVANGPLRFLLENRIVCQGVRLTQGDGSQSLGVHTAAKIARYWVLLAEQEVDPALDIAAVFSLLMSLSDTQERQET